jgi:hypothetical protein
MCSGTRASRAHQGILWVQNCKTCARLFRIGRKIRGGICGILKQRKSAARAAAKSKRPKASEAITATQRVGTQTGSGAGTQGAAHAPVACTAGRPADEHSPVSALAKQVGSLRLLEFLVGSRGLGIPCWKPRGRPVRRPHGCGCRHVFYCDKTCQKRDWRHHKPECAWIVLTEFELPAEVIMSICKFKSDREV